MRKAGAKHIYVDTSSSDRYAGTRGFYQRMGFPEEARLADFYGPGDSKVIYVKAFDFDPNPAPLHRSFGERSRAAIDIPAEPRCRHPPRVASDMKC